MTDEIEYRAVPFAAIYPYLLLAFALPWCILGLYIAAPEWAVSVFGQISGAHPLFVLAVYSPAFAAIAVVSYFAGLHGLRRYLSRLLLVRAPAPWWAFLLFGIPAIYFAGAFLKGNVASAPLLTESFASLLPAIAFMMVLGPVEELGWRGIALPLLQRRLAPAWAGLLLGLIWGVWHLPAFYLSGTPQSEWGFMPFLIGAIAVSLILTPLFNRSGGSILLAMLFHFQLNNPLWPDAQPNDTVFFVLAAIIILFLNRSAMFDRRAGVTAIAPPADRPRSIRHGKQGA